MDKTSARQSDRQTRKAVRRQLRGPADLQYAIADSIHLLNPEVWNHVTKGSSFFLSLPYLAAMEAVLPHNIAPRYALIFDEHDGERVPVAAMVMQVVDIALSQTRPVASAAATGKWLAPLAGKLADTTQRVLACGNFLTFGMHGIAFAATSDGLDSANAWHGVAEVLYRVRSAEKLAGKTHFVLIKDLHDPHIAPARVLEDLSYRYVETEPDMLLSLDPAWKSYDDYLGGLASKYRANIRNGVLKPIDEAGCRVETLADVSAAADTLYRHYLAVHERASFRPFTLRPEYFASLQRVAGDRFRCSVVRQGDRLLGFLISVGDGDTAIAYHVGFDRDAARALPVYLRLLHAGIADAISLGCKQVSYGRTALEPKAALGAKPRSFGVLVRHRQPVLNKLIKRILTGMEHDEAPVRNPFKSVSG